MRFRPEALDVVESPLVQIATAAEQMPGSLKLCYGESDRATPAFICRAATEAMLAPGSAFGPGGEGHVRLCFAASQDILGEALARFRD